MTIILLLISFSFAEPKFKHVAPEPTPHPCDFPRYKYNKKNLNDLNSLSGFLLKSELYPYVQFHCNGVTCTAQEFENMCYKMRQASKAGQDPNLVMPNSPMP